ncbi:MAG: hypothetical protein QXR13_03390, partial [Candidatus Bathyarchaeia archaeon]
MYGYDWMYNTSTGSWQYYRSVVYTTAIETMNAYGATRLWQWSDSGYDSHEPYYNYTGTLTHQVFYQDVESFRYKVGLAKYRGISKVAVWRLVGEDPSIWELINTWKEGGLYLFATSLYSNITVTWGNNVTLEWTISTPYPGNYNISRNGTLLSSGQFRNGYTITYVVDPKAQGLNNNTVYEFKLNLSDGFNTSSSSVFVTVVPSGGNQPPTVSITYPVNGSRLSGMCDVSLVTSDPDGDTVSVTLFISSNLGGPWTSVNSTTSNLIWWDTTLFSDNYYYLKAVANDGKGGISSVIVGPVLVDNINEAPWITITSVSSTIGEISVEWSASDPDLDELNVTILLLNGTDVIKGVSDLINNGSYVLNVSDVKYGTYSLRVSVVDGKGGTNFDEKSVEVIVANNNPYVAIIYPTTNSKVNATFKILLNISDPDNDAVFTEIYVSRNLSDWEYVNSTTTNECEWNTINWNDGFYYIRVIARDERGGESTSVVGPFIVDNINEKPIIVRLTVATSPGKITVEWSATDPDFDNITVTIKVMKDGALKKEIMNLPSNGTYIVDVSDLPSGDYVVRIIFADEKGETVVDEKSIY